MKIRVKSKKLDEDVIMCNSLRTDIRRLITKTFLAFSHTSKRGIDLLTSRAFERGARASESSTCFPCSESHQVTSFWRELLRMLRAGSYHTRPENQANDFEKV